ncbi:MAG: hypothetical protein JJ863_25950 [Deltaproteobacteria bacterium]|nr:hypothetical protein [Deltaproteobacteria bacterium]
MSRMIRSMVALATLTALPTVAHAGNDDTYFMSGEAALMGGAVVALGQGAGMVWYNPAGLGSIHRSQYDLTLSGVAYQRRLVPDGVVVVVPGDMGNVELPAELDGSRATTIAPAAVYARRFGKVTLGAGFFTSRDEVIRLNVSDASPAVGGSTTTTLIDIDIAETRYHLGGGLGFELLGGALKLGASVFVVYDGANDSASIGASIASPDDERIDLTAAALNDSDRWALAAHIGAQVHPTEWLQLGLNVRLPMLLLKDNPDDSTLIQAGVQVLDPMTNELTGATTSIYQPSRPAAGVGQLEPMRLMLGAGLLLGGVKIGLGFDYSPPLRTLDVRRPGDPDPDYLVDRTSVWNLRAGTLIPINDTLALGAGVFTDRSAAPTPTSGLTDYRVDYYGGTLGIRTDTPVGLREGEHAETLVFRTTVAVRYAYGTGESRQSRIDFSTGELPIPSPGELVDVQFHELYIFIGSSLMF